jgi:hypothetical protein
MIKETYNLIRLYSDGRPPSPGKFDFHTIEEAVREANRKNRALSDLGADAFRWVVAGPIQVEDTI